MKRLKLISKRKIDLLIVDEAGSDFVKYCVPNHIDNKIFNLINKDQNEYLSDISDSQSYYMNYGKEFAHHIIKERIRSFVYDEC